MTNGIAPESGPRPASSTPAAGGRPDLPLSADRIDFLKLTVAAAESHLRAYDTKAQITLAAFVLSLNPLWILFQSVCRQGVDPEAVAALLVSVLTTLVAYGATVWPASASRRASSMGSTPAASTSSGLFFLPGDADTEIHHYLAGLRGLDVGEALADEVLKLARLRRGKAMRLKLALVCTIVSYALLLALFATRHQCA